MFSTHDILKLYRSGMSFENIGAKVGRHESTIRYHLWKLPGYRRLVSSVLLSRLARAHGKRFKNALWQLRRHRPVLYARWLARNAPQFPNPVRIAGREWRCDCPKCMKSRCLYARKVKGAWQWRCQRCGADSLTVTSIKA
jgi:hypothetical protein